MNTRPESVLDFCEGFAARVDAYIRSQGMKQFEFGNLIGWSSGGVNAALRRPREKCSEKFVSDVSVKISGFAHEYAAYRKLLDDARGVSTATGAVAASRAKNLAEKFREIAREASAIADDLEGMADDQD